MAIYWISTDISSYVKGATSAVVLPVIYEYDNFVPYEYIVWREWIVVASFYLSSALLSVLLCLLIIIIIFTYHYYYFYLLLLFLLIISIIIIIVSCDIVVVILIVTIYCYKPLLEGLLLLTWIDWFHHGSAITCPVKCGMKLSIIPKLQQLHHWSLGMWK